MSLTLYTTNNNSRGWKALVAAQYNGVNIETKIVEIGKDNRTTKYIKDNTNGKVPALVTEHGGIFESNAIARYVARINDSYKYFFGTNTYEAALVEQWIEWTRLEVEFPASIWLYPIFGYMPYNAEATAKAKEDIRKALGILNDHLASHTFLVGERVSLADIIVALAFHGLYSHVLDPGFRKLYTHTNRWFLTVVNQPNFKAVAGETLLADKTKTAPKPVEAPKEHKPKEQKPKEQKPKEQKPKEQKPKEQQPNEAAAEEEDDTPKEERKASALASLPPSKLKMDDWKRKYSNAKDTKGEAIPWFWENFDPEGYSIWFSDYKYNSELEKTFMTCNLIGGFIQRLDELRKYGFGSLLIFGEEPNLEISGCWLFRGLEIPEEMKECPYSESYTFRKVDLTSDADKELIADFWAWEGKFGGRDKPFNQGKVFK